MVKMQYINTRPLTLMVNRVQDSPRLQSAFNQLNQSCRLGFKFEFPENILAMARRINQRMVREKKYKPSEDNQGICNWSFGEYKIFMWIILFKSIIYSLPIQNFTVEITKEIQGILKSKSITFIQYEIRLLISQKFEILNEPWEEEELKMLNDIMTEVNEKGGSPNWRAVSFELYRKSQGIFFRDMNHCREKWFNHLNPIVKKGEWSFEEDKRIFQLIAEHGYRWAVISKHMGKTRTEHMVKNRFSKYAREWKVPRNVPVEKACQLFKKCVVQPKNRNTTLFLKIRARKIKRSQDNDWLVGLTPRVRPPLSDDKDIEQVAQDSLASRKEAFQQQESIESAQNEVKVEEAEESNVFELFPSSQEKEETIVKTDPEQAPCDYTTKIEPEEMPKEDDKCKKQPQWDYYPFMNVYGPLFPF